MSHRPDARDPARPPTGPAPRGGNEPARAAPRCIVLVGFMAAGKSTVGRLLADRLGWRFLDLDEEIARNEGSSIPELFRTRGEAAFRALERELTASLSWAEDTVFAPGGGWITDPDALGRLPAGGRIVWLRVSVEEALRRVRKSGAERPMLAGHDPVAAATRLLAEREHLYRQADTVIDVDGMTPAQIALAIAASMGIEADANQAG